MVEYINMTVENITRRYNFTYKELEDQLDIEGKIERVSQVGQYEKDQDPEVKDTDVVITTLEHVEPKEDEEKKKHKLTNDFRL